MILITGSTGFVGSALTQHLQQQGYPLTAAVRRITDSFPPSIQQTPVGDLLPDTDWTTTLHNVDTIIHLAAQTPNRSTTAKQLNIVNHLATLNLAQHAASKGVRRFIFLSSIKVSGEITQQGERFKADNSTSPTDPYGLSKYQAEQGLLKIARQTGIEIVIIRPPLVYGAGVKGNFLSMMGWLQKGILLPLGNLHNQRSLVALSNLIDLITTCIDHPAAANQTFLVSDGEDLSTTELLQRLSKALGKPARLLPVPQKLLETTLNLLGKQSIAQRLCGNLQIDMIQTRELLSWTPPVSVDEALQQTAQTYLQALR